MLLNDKEAPPVSSQLQNDPQHGSSKVQLVATKVEGEVLGKRARTVDSARKVTRKPVTSPELGTMPFSPESLSQVSFKRMIELIEVNSELPHPQLPPSDSVNPVPSPSSVKTRKKLKLDV